MSKYTEPINIQIESASDPELRDLGKDLRRGAKKSFADYAADALKDWLNRNL